MVHYDALTMPLIADYIFIKGNVIVEITKMNNNIRGLFIKLPIFSIPLTDYWSLSLTFISSVSTLPNSSEKFLLKCPADSFMPSIVSNRCPFSIDCKLGNKQKM